MWGITEELLKKPYYVVMQNFILPQIKNSLTFMNDVDEYYKHPEKEGIDEIELNDGKIFECLTQPQWHNKHIVGRVWSFQDITLRRKIENMLSFQATHDMLTHLPNRLSLLDHATKVTFNALQEKKSISLTFIFIDLDRFNRINNSLTHTIGDEFLKAVGTRLSHHTRAEDFLARLESDEFVVMLRDVAEENIPAIINKLQKCFSYPFDVSSHNINMTASIGVSVYPTHGKDLPLLLTHAETAMKQAKRLGGHTFQFYNPKLNTHNAAKIKLETALYDAIEKNALTLHYQPLYHLQTLNIVGAEALLRWEYPPQNPISPLKFIPLAEETGLIIPISEWVIMSACKQMVAWEKQNLSLRLAINISVKQFILSDFINTVSKILDKTQCNPHNIEFEITESIILQDSKKILKKMYALKQIGISLAIDDFGTGYSNLSYLKKFPIDKLKIDQSFIRGLNNKDDQAIVLTIIALAKNLKLCALAEGIEMKQQFIFLRNNFCDQGQGFYFSKAMSADSFTKLFKQRSLTPQLIAD